MKQVVYLVIVLVAAAAFYVFAYPRLAGGVASAATAAPATSGTAAVGGQGRGGKAGGAGGYATGVVVAVAQRQTVPITKSAVGFVEPATSVVLRSRADGTVAQQSVTEGQMVKTGDVLFKLDDRSTQAQLSKDQAQIAKDQANAASAQAALTREQDLVKKGVDPQSTLDVDVAAAKSAQATIGVDNAQLNADQVLESYMTITAPIDGRVGTVNTSVGNVVHAADASADGLLTITALSPLRVSFSIAEGDLDSFRNALAKSARLPVKILAPGDTAPRATGTLSFIDSSVDTTSGTIVIKADVDNSAGKLWPGQYVTAITQLGAYDDATTIPLVAVQQSDSGPYVFAVGADSKAKKQKLTVVATVGETVIAGPEIKPNDHVVVEGQLRLTDGGAVRETVQAGKTDVASSGTGTDGSSVATGTGSAGAAPAGGAAAASGTAAATGAPAVAAAAGNS